MNLLERIWDRIFWTFILLIGYTLLIVIFAVDFFLSLFFQESYEVLKQRYFAAPADQAIASYRAFQKERPVVAWFFKWPLMLVGM